MNTNEKLKVSGHCLGVIFKTMDIVFKLCFYPNLNLFSLIDNSLHATFFLSPVNFFVQQENLGVKPIGSRSGRTFCRA